jgi:hypothetical protein
MIKVHQYGYPKKGQVTWHGTGRVGTGRVGMGWTGRAGTCQAAIGLAAIGRDWSGWRRCLVGDVLVGNRSVMKRLQQTLVAADPPSFNWFFSHHFFPFPIWLKIDH